MQTLYSIIFIFAMIGSAGSIDGGYKGVPMNDNWTLCFILFAVGLLFGFLSIREQAKGN